MVDATDVSDWHLLIEVGDEDALGTLFERHKDYVFRLACGFLGERDLAEDVTQEVFLRMARGRRRWSRQAKFTTWLYKMTFNTAHELRRRRQRQARWQGRFDDSATVSAAVGSAAAGLSTVVLTTAAPTTDPIAPLELERLLATLPDRQREVLVLRYLEGMSTREAAAVAGCSQGTVKTHLHRAFSQLRRRLKEETE